jgi:8-oxo-dGTP diphosphatase
MNSIDLLNIEVIEAAGGLLWKVSTKGIMLTIIHRPRYNDWTLPKGKKKEEESWHETALREVLEETGCNAKIEDFAGGIIYQVGNLPKVVLFWHMWAIDIPTFIPNNEVDSCEWVHPELAISKLTYSDEKELVKSAIGSGWT